VIFTKEEMEVSALLLVVSDVGLVKWSSHKTRDQVVSMLRDCADQIEGGDL
jgi:hypothetical protein